MKLAIFGGTGKGGRFLVPLALDAGHEVVLLTRDPSKMTLKNARLTVVKGDISDPAQVDAVISGADAVMSSLGPNKQSPPFIMSKGFDNILSSMKQHNVRRLVMSCGAVIHDPKDKPRFLDNVFNFIWSHFQTNVYDDMTQVIQKVRASDRDWTVVRVPYLSERFTKPGPLKVGYLGDIGSMTTRTELANFMLKQLDSDTYVGKSIAISN